MLIDSYQEIIITNINYQVNNESNETMPEADIFIKDSLLEDDNNCDIGCYTVIILVSIITIVCGLMLFIHTGYYKKLKYWIKN